MSLRPSTAIKKLLWAMTLYYATMYCSHNNTLVKIQYGGLLGLQAMMSPEKTDSTQVENIEKLIAQAGSTYGGLANVPLETINETIANFKIQRRRKK